MIYEIRGWKKAYYQWRGQKCSVAKESLVQQDDPVLWEEVYHSQRLLVLAINELSMPLLKVQSIISTQTIWRICIPKVLFMIGSKNVIRKVTKVSWMADNNLKSSLTVLAMGVSGISGVVSQVGYKYCFLSYINLYSYNYITFVLKSWKTL